MSDNRKETPFKKKCRAHAEAIGAKIDFYTEYAELESNYVDRTMRIRYADNSWKVELFSEHGTGKGSARSLNKAVERASIDLGNLVAADYKLTFTKIGS